MHSSINPVFIIGAARSGTNILRDSLCKVPQFTTWPCDEINLIFRHGNLNSKTDEFQAFHAGTTIKKFIKNEFELLSKKFPDSTIVEKTCANSLRVPFLLEIFPHAKFIFLIRNGYDVVASAKLRWTSKIEPKYLVKKIRFVPIADFPYHIVNFLKNRLFQFFSKEKRVAIWGPIYNGMKEDVITKTLDEVCALQWRNTVVKAFEDLNKLAPKDTLFISYECMCANPSKTFSRVFEFLNTKIDNSILTEIKNEIRFKFPGNGKSKINSDVHIEVSAIIDPVMHNIHAKIQNECNLY